MRHFFTETKAGRIILTVGIVLAVLIVGIWIGIRLLADAVGKAFSRLF